MHQKTEALIKTAMEYLEMASEGIDPQISACRSAQGQAHLLIAVINELHMLRKEIESLRE